LCSTRLGSTPSGLSTHCAPRVCSTRGYLHRCPKAEIAALVRVSGTPSVKARRLRAICETIVRAGGIDAFLAQPADALRSQLLATHGVGDETADAIALYAGGRRRSSSMPIRGASSAGSD